MLIGHTSLVTYCQTYKMESFIIQISDICIVRPLARSLINMQIVNIIYAANYHKICNHWYLIGGFGKDDSSLYGVTPSPQTAPKLHPPFFFMLFPQSECKIN